jgi:hypothetical protein
VLFGGLSPSMVRLNDTWTWNGVEWQQAAPGPNVPAPRAGHGMAFDSARNVVVMFGGTGTNDNAVWEWDGQQWTSALRNPAPEERTGVSLAYDAARGMTVLFGGTTLASQLPANTWGWNGVEWTLLANAGPPGRRDGAMAYDAARQEVVLYQSDAELVLRRLVKRLVRAARLMCGIADGARSAG